MSRSPLLQKLQSEQLRGDIPDFAVGDTVSVHMRIIEGEKERIQVFTGTVIARSGGGLSETFSLHRVAYGVGMERVFPLHSPRIAKIVKVKEGEVSRAKLYYLRGKTGKKARIRERVRRRKEVTTEVAATPEEESLAAVPPPETAAEESSSES